MLCTTPPVPPQYITGSLSVGGSLIAGSGGGRRQCIVRIKLSSISPSGAGKDLFIFPFDRLKVMRIIFVRSCDCDGQCQFYDITSNKKDMLYFCLMSG